MLKIIDLEKSYSVGLFKKQKVLKKISFEIIPNKITGFLGPNGAGKTTTIKIIMGLLKEDSGKIEIDGETINDNARKRIGYLPETPSFYPFLTPREFLSFIGELNGFKKASILEMIEKIANDFIFKEYLHKGINTLSKGTLQKIAFSQALIGDPELIILDEPFSGLDPIVMNEIREYILALKGKKTIFLSSHMLHEMERICDNIVLINQGRIVLKGDVKKMKYKWKITKALENDEKLRTVLLKDMDIKTIIRKIIEGDNKISQLIDTNIIEEALLKIGEPTLEEIFLQSIKMSEYKWEFY